MLRFALAPLALLLAAPADRPGEEKLFGDWAVACDNANRCQATALLPEGSATEPAPELLLTREAGPEGAITIDFGWEEPVHDQLFFRVDGIIRAGDPGRGRSYRMTGRMALGLARQLPQGRALAISTHEQRLAFFSLTGAAAALRWMDAQQGRAGTTTALAATGSALALTVPAAPALPRIAAVRPGPGTPPPLPASRWPELVRQADCELAAMAPGGPERHRLDARTTLLAVPCIVGAYQTGYALFVRTGDRIVPAPLDDPPGEGAVPLLIAPAWDAATGTLETHTKGRGLGDCGFNQRWVWDGSRFRLVFRNGLSACRLSGLWLTTFRATPAYR